MIKLFASDLDGTLFNAMHETDSFIRSAIEEITAAGVRVVPSTGRSVLPGGKHGFGGLGLDGVCANGSIVRAGSGEVLKTFTVDPSFTEELVKAFPHICFNCHTPEGVYSTGTREMHMAGFKNDTLPKRLMTKFLRSRGATHEEQHYEQPLSTILSLEVCKINCRVANDAEDRELKAFLADHTDTVVNAPFDPVLFEITDKDCNKGASIAWLAAYYGIDEDEVAVYGDSGNDLVMLRRFRHSYATSNATPDAKEAASATIGNCAFHAVPKHMLRTLHDQRDRVAID